jgi:PAS domain S-box-containing protein
MQFVAEKDSGLIPQVLSKILDSCVNGVTLADPDLDDMPIVYANKAFTDMTGYSLEETIGHNCRYLQGADREQVGRKKIRDAISKHESCEVTLRNYRKNGELFYNRLNISALFDRDGNVIYYLGVQYDVTKEVLAEKEIKRLTEQLHNVAVPGD